MDEQLEPRHATLQSRLLSLPAEIRLHIFGYILEDVRCRQPLVIWDSIYSTSRLASHWPVEGALLLTCRLIYSDCSSILYDTTKVELSLRGDEPDNVTRRALKNLGVVDNSTFLPKLRHIELEVIYEGCNHFAVHRTVSRLSRLRRALQQTGKLKSVELVLFDQGSVPRAVQGIDEYVPEVDQILEEALRFADFTKIRGASRNVKASRSSMSAMLWSSLREKFQGGQNDEEEQFSEINCDYWEERCSPDMEADDGRDCRGPKLLSSWQQGMVKAPST